MTTFQQLIEKDASGANQAYSFTRDDGTSSAFWSNRFHLWFKCGFDFAGEYVIGDGAHWQIKSTGASSPPKVSFGGEASGRVCLFDPTMRTVGGGADLKYIQGPASGDYSGSWTTRTLAAISGYTSYVQANDVATDGDRMIVVGGGDLASVPCALAWTSTNGGTSFTRDTVAIFPMSSSALNRIVIGAGRAVTFYKGSAATGGDKIYYLADYGLWVPRNDCGFDNISEAAYAAGFWHFASGSVIYRTRNLVTGTFDATIAAGTVTAMTSFEDELVYAADVSGGWREIWAMNGTGAQRCLARNPSIAGQAYTGIAKDPRGRLLFQTPSGLQIASR